VIGEGGRIVVEKRRLPDQLRAIRVVEDDVA
jgi:hypothetical protein